MRYLPLMLEPLTLTVPGGRTHPAVLALPDGDGPFPGVVVIHDLVGFKPDVERHCRRFAEEGYAAIAPDLYDGGRIGCVVSALLSMRRGRGPAMEIIAAARSALAGRPEVDPDRLGVTGFCMGGGFALLAAADDAYAVAAPFYGAVPPSAERLRGICPTLAQYGERDRAFVPQAQLLRRHLETLGVPHQVIIHPNVGHSFMNDHEGWFFALGAYTPLRARHDAETEEIAWQEMIAFFDEHLPSSSAATA